MGGSSSKKQAIKVNSERSTVTAVQDHEDQHDHVINPPARNEIIGDNELIRDNHRLISDSPKNIKHQVIDFNKRLSLSDENTPTPTTTPNLSKSRIRSPLQFDQNNISHQPPQHVSSDGLMTSPSVMTSPRRSQSGNRQFGSNISSVTENQIQFNKSQNFYNQPRDKISGRYNSYSGTSASLENHTPSHFSGVYNRHGDQAGGGGGGGKARLGGSDPNVSSLLRKDKFTLLGSQLQQQESQIFSRSLQQTNGTRTAQAAPTFSSSLGAAAPPPATTNKFDPNKFRRVNEHTAPFTSNTWDRHGMMNGSIKKAGIGGGPLDERDEELIASIEREFDFSY